MPISGAVAHANIKTYPVINVDFSVERSANGTFMSLGDHERSIRFGKTIHRDGNIISAYVLLGFDSDVTPTESGHIFARLWRNDGIDIANFMCELRAPVDVNEASVRFGGLAEMYTGTVSEIFQTGLDDGSERRVNTVSVARGDTIIAEWESFGPITASPNRYATVSLEIAG